MKADFFEKWILAFIVLGLLCVALLLTGCGARTIYVKDGDPVRIAETIPRASVWVQDANGKWVKGKVDLQEGWYALPDPGKE
jgi:hypothetical protein